jgi:hypothetical protein
MQLEKLSSGLTEWRGVSSFRKSWPELLGLLEERAPALMPQHVPRVVPCTQNSPSEKNPLGGLAPGSVLAT